MTLAQRLARFERLAAELADKFGIPPGDLLQLARDYETNRKELERDAARYRWLRQQWADMPWTEGYIDAAIAKDQQSALDEVVALGQEMERG